MKRKDEEFAKSKFDEFLTSLTQHSPKWEEVKQADEPPDYYLHYGDQEFAVEVTSIMEMLDTGDETQSSPGISISLGRFIEGIEQRAQSQGRLHGAYVVHPEPLKDFSAVRDSGFYPLRVDGIISIATVVMRGSYGRRNTPARRPKQLLLEPCL